MMNCILDVELRECFVCLCNHDVYHGFSQVCWLLFETPLYMHVFVALLD